MPRRCNGDGRLCLGEVGGRGIDAAGGLGEQRSVASNSARLKLVDSCWYSAP
jgi:hypothetical protein